MSDPDDTRERVVTLEANVGHIKEGMADFKVSQQTLVKGQVGIIKELATLVGYVKIMTSGMILTAVAGALLKFGGS